MKSSMLIAALIVASTCSVFAQEGTATAPATTPAATAPKVDKKEDKMMDKKAKKHHKKAKKDSAVTKAKGDKA